jgi:hypothetical protein
MPTASNDKMFSEHNLMNGWMCKKATVIWQLSGSVWKITRTVVQDGKCASRDLHAEPTYTVTCMGD